MKKKKAKNANMTTKIINQNKITKKFFFKESRKVQKITSCILSAND